MISCDAATEFNAIKNLARFLAVGLAAISATGCISSASEQPSRRSEPRTISCDTQQGFFSELLELTNLQRIANGLNALVISLELVEAAQVHSVDMANNNFFSHTGSDGSRPWERAQEQGYGSIFVGENIAAGYTSAAAVVEGWMNSQGHRENILKPEYTEIGFGFFSNPNSQYGNYWTQKFGNRDNSGSSTGDPVPRNFLRDCQTAIGETNDQDVLGELPPDLLASDALVGTTKNSSDVAALETIFNEPFSSHYQFNNSTSVQVPEPTGNLNFLILLLPTGLYFTRKKWMG